MLILSGLGDTSKIFSIQVDANISTRANNEVGIYFINIYFDLDFTSDTRCCKLLLGWGEGSSYFRMSICHVFAEHCCTACSLIAARQKCMTSSHWLCCQFPFLSFEIVEAEIPGPNLVQYRCTSLVRIALGLHRMRPALYEVNPNFIIPRTVTLSGLKLVPSSHKGPI